VPGRPGDGPAVAGAQTSRERRDEAAGRLRGGLLIIHFSFAYLIATTVRRPLSSAVRRETAGTHR